jgi:hypothetical protein
MLCQMRSTRASTRRVLQSECAAGDLESLEIAPNAGAASAEGLINALTKGANMKILSTQVLPALLALAFLALAPSYALAQGATSSEDTRGDTWITCKKGKGNNEAIVNISDCNSLFGRMQAGFKCTGRGVFSTRHSS